jgi:CHAT domain
LQVIAGPVIAVTPLPHAPAHGPPSGFLSVADPIYNFADPRWKSTLTPRERFQWFWASLRGAGGPQLNRLPGTRREVESSAAAWNQGTTTRITPAHETLIHDTLIHDTLIHNTQTHDTQTRILEGPDASREKFLESLSPAPQVIHLATHALTPDTGEEAFLAFGLGPNGRLEMLSASAVRTLQVPGSVVVMTGCSTAPSNLDAGLGLSTLVHAWAVAGARAVVATEWEVGDNAGSALLSSFYTHLGEIPNNVPEALRLAQVEMIHSGAAGSPAQAAPASWAAYQVFSNQSFTSIGLGSRSSAK